MRVHLLAATAALLLLAACKTATTSPIGGPEPPRAPTRDAAVCPAEATARQADEPLPPEGVSASRTVAALVDALGEEKALAVWKWWTVTYPGWARDNFERLKVTRAWCKTLAKPPD